MLDNLWNKIYEFDKSYPLFFSIWDICVAMSVVIAIMTDSKLLPILVVLTIMNLLRSLLMLIKHLKNIKNNNKKRG
jgi:hypothetical protein|nr:MAG TPA: hypothetical protein [Caudoviricetes sp.]